MAHVGRPQDDLGEHPRERARFERDRPALAIDGRPGDPAAAPEQVDDDVARPGVEVDPRVDDRRRRRGREAIEDGKRVPRLGDGGSASGHAADASRVALGLADG